MINDGRREILIARSPAPRCLGGGGCERRSGAGARSLGPGRPIARSTTPSAAEKPRNPHRNSAPSVVRRPSIHHTFCVLGTIPLCVWWSEMTEIADDFEKIYFGQRSMHAAHIVCDWVRLKANKIVYIAWAICVSCPKKNPRKYPRETNLRDMYSQINDGFFSLFYMFIRFSIIPSRRQKWFVEHVYTVRLCTKSLFAVFWHMCYPYSIWLTNCIQFIYRKLSELMKR